MKPIGVLTEKAIRKTNVYYTFAPVPLESYNALPIISFRAFASGGEALLKRGAVCIRIVKTLL